jgi:hypothetical protein
MFAFLLMLLLPGVLIALFVVSGAASILLFGALPIAVAYFAGAARSTARIITFMVVSGTVARLLDQDPVPSALLMAVVAFIIGMTARRGLSSPILFVGIALGFLIISPPALGESGHQALNNLNPVLLTAALLLIGGLWARLVIFGIKKWIPDTPETTPRTALSLIPYSLSLAIASGISTYFLLRYAPGGSGAWLILTIFVVLQVDPKNTVTKTRDRVIGTVSGAVAAFVLIELLRVFNLQEGLAQLILALVFLGASMYYFIPGPYWKYVFFLTPGIVLLDSNAVSDQTSVDAWRVGFTLIGVAAALGIGLVVHVITHTLYQRKHATPDQ